MNQREAKREVCRAAADILETGANEWLTFQWRIPDEPGCPEQHEKLADADSERLTAAFIELVTELQRRGGG